MRPTDQPDVARRTPEVALPWAWTFGLSRAEIQELRAFLAANPQWDFRPSAAHS